MKRRRSKKTNYPVTYIDKLTFDKNLLSGFASKYFVNVRLMVLLLLSIAFLGISSIITLPKTLNPEVDIPFFVISTVLPGSAPEDVESLITNPIENELKKIKGIDAYSSVSQENSSLITIEFSPNSDIDEARNDLQVAVDLVKTELPEDASEPNLQQLDFENIPVWIFSLHEKRESESALSLQRLGENIKETLENQQLISRVDLSGFEERNIQILVKPEIIKSWGVSLFNIIDAITQAVRSYPAGKVITGTNEFSVVIDQPATSIAELRDIPVEVDDVNYKLSDFAEVSEQPTPNQNASFYARHGNPIQPVIVFSVYKTREGRIDDSKKQAEEVVNQIIKEQRDYFEVITINDFAKEIDDQLWDLSDNFIQTLVLIFISMFLLYGARQSLIASLAIPFSLLIIFFAMQVLELSINFLTIYSLLIGLGLFTDNAVVIIQGFTSIYRSKKFSPLEAALLTWRDYATQLFSINLLTVWAFLPLLTLSGIIGEFIKPMPIIVSVAMMSSVFIALLFTLPSIKLLVDLKLPTRVVFLFRFLLASFILISAVLIIPRNILYVPSLLTFIVLVVNIVILRRELLREIKNKIKSNGEIERLAILFRKTFSRGLISLDRLTDYYRGALQRIIERPSRRKKVLLVIGIFTVFSYLLFPLGYVKNEFFPKSGSDRLYITLELPLGTNKETSEAEARKLIPNFLNHPAVEFITAEIGKGYNNGFDLTQPESNNVLFTIYLIPESERKNSLIISDEFRQTYADYNKGKIKVLDANVGPPAGADLDIRIIGEDLDELQKIAVNIEQFLDKLEGTANIEKSIKPGKTKIVFEPNKEALLAEGIQESQIGFWLRSHITGLDVKRVNFEGDEINTVIRVDKDLLTPEMLSLVEISKEGKNIPISQLGNFYLAPNPNLIPHNDGERTITVTASAETGFNPVQLNKSLENYVKNELELPDGYSWEFGGVNQENMEANQGILVAMVISSILILATMVVQLGSFRKALIVMLVIPLAISGVFILFALTATPLSFPASMGILSLFGIVIANSLMIVEKVTKNLKIGFSFEEAIPEAATSRIEPIILTSAAQIIGLIPATLADPIWRGFGGAIISGLAFSGLIMLFFIPVVYYYLFPELRKR